jgi:hypothetical protein
MTDLSIQQQSHVRIEDYRYRLLEKVRLGIIITHSIFIFFSFIQYTQHMKKILLFLSCFSLWSVTYGQANDLKVVASAGTTFTAGNLSLDWTLGEVIVDTYDEPGLGLTQGFHQPVYQLVAVKSIPTELGLITVFPNPFSDVLMVKMNFAAFEKGEMELVDNKGTSIWKKPFEGNEIIENYSASSLPSGSYRLAVTLAGDTFIQSYQLLKIQ